jgi:uncharacterized membrane protein YGL010W
MTDVDHWLTHYGKGHQNMAFPVIYWMAVPALVIGTVGLLWSLPVPGEFLDISPVLNWGTTFLMAAVVYYFIISLSLAIGMLPLVFGVIALEMWLEISGLPLRRISAGLVFGGVVGLYLGHYGRGGTSAVVRDVQLMIIAPIWLLSNVYRRLGIPY